MAKKKKINKTSTGLPSSVNDDLPPEKSYYNLKRPYLITRLGAGLLDLAVSIALVVGLQFLLAYLLYAPLGYYSAHDEVLNTCEESHLFFKTEAGDYDLITDHYDNSKTLEENLDAPIVYYYSEADYPKTFDKIGKYNTAKVATGFWNADNQRTASFDEMQAKTWLIGQYNDAVSLCENSPSYVAGTNHMIYVTYFTLLISIVIGSLPCYLIVPLLNKQGATPFQLLFKMGLADKETDKQVKKSQIVLRYIILLGLDFLLPEVWWYFFGAGQYLFGIPFFADLAIMCLTPNNTSIHDVVSRSYVISVRGDVDFKDLDEKKKADKKKKDVVEEGKVGTDFFD